jgi:hypothetical protein
MNRTLALLLAAAASASVVACGSMSSETSSLGAGDERNAGAAAGSSSGGAMNAGTAEPGSSSSGGSSSGGTTGTDGPNPGSQQQAGQLTAGVWDDNLNFDFFAKYAAKSELSLQGLPTFTSSERTAAKDKFAQRSGKTQLDIAFLFDTTGSMGDELSYLNAEIDAIADSISLKYPAATVRYGLVLYRDQGDAYVTKKYDFVESLATFQTTLSQQGASGGGDYPEAVAEGLADANALSWRADAGVARVTFWIADAPTHAAKTAALKTAIQSSIQQDIHIYPVSASGTDERAEYAMRSAAQITGGRYIFLTDDSGIGGTHAEPHIPCYVVTKFDRALVRMVESEMSGQHVFAPAPEVLRTVGSPVDGKCQTQSSGQVVLY